MEKIYFVVFVLLLITECATAEVVFTAPPRENEMQGIKLYGPVVKRLSELLGEKVIYEQPKNWLEYSKKMRNDEYDILFDGPHFTAWRIKHLGHLPVAALPGQLEYLLITHNAAVYVNNHRDLVGKKICGMPSPQLATDMILDLYKNPTIQPTIYEVKGGLDKMFDAFKQGKCMATIFRADYYYKLPQYEKNELKIVAKTRVLPNQSVSISKRLRKNANRITKFFTSRDGAITATKLLARYSDDARYFVQPDKNKFIGAEDVLEGIVFGW